ncbi:MarR family winged helix-turn-helix transcriptional regulator [Clostridium sp. DL1XJH146]
MDSKEKLYKTYSYLMEIKGECSCTLLEKFNVSELTIRQISYLRKFDEYEYITSSELAEILNLSKPSVTEMIKKFIKLDCVYKKQCSKDGRVQYIHLTEKGKFIARIEELKIRGMIDRIIESLEDEEIDNLVKLLYKIN